MAEKEENEREDCYKGERHGQKVEAKGYSDNLKMGVGGRKVITVPLTWWGRTRQRMQEQQAC